MRLSTLFPIIAVMIVSLGFVTFRFFTTRTREKRIISYSLIFLLTILLVMLAAVIYVIFAISLSAMHGSPPETAYIGWLLVSILIVLPVGSLIFIRLYQEVHWGVKGAGGNHQKALLLKSSFAVFILSWLALTTVVTARLAMILSLENNDTGMVKLLLSLGISPNMKMVITGEEHRPLYYAACHGNSEMVRLLLAKGADISAEDALIDAIIAGSPEVIQILLQEGADPNQGSDYSSPLMWAVERRNSKIVRLLLEHGAKIDFINSRDMTAMDTAIEKGYGEITQLLLRHGAKTKISSPQREQAFFSAVDEKDFAKLQLLLDKGTNINSRDELQQSPLIHAISYGNREAAIWLLEHEAMTDILDVNGRNALWYAADKGLSEVVARLLPTNSDINSFDRYKKTALMAACERGNREVVKLLLDHGAGVNVREGDHGRSALDIAQENNRHEIVQLLLAHGTKAASGKGPSSKTGF